MQKSLDWHRSFTVGGRPGSPLRSASRGKLLAHSSLNAKKPRLTSKLYLGWKTGLEPATFGTTIRRSNLLSYIHRFADAKIDYFLNIVNPTSTFFTMPYYFVLITQQIYAYPQIYDIMHLALELFSI